MNLRMVGCHHLQSSLAVRERLAFNPAQAERALVAWRDAHPETEAVLLSTCNRVEFYTAAESDVLRPCSHVLTKYLADFHQVPVEYLEGELFFLQDEEVVGHLFRVAASLDSMVVGESQILAQVKQAYELAGRLGCTGPLTNQFFQAALRAARRVASETSLHRHRVSIPSVAIADFASRIFQQFDDKCVLVIGAGDMAAETVRYLVQAGARQIRIINRNHERAELLAASWRGRPIAWEHLYRELAAADIVVSTTGAAEPIVSLEIFRSQVVDQRQQRPLFILDLAMPRDFDPAISDELGTYLYSIDDLTEACEQNRQARVAALPAAEQIVDTEARSFLAEARHRITAPVIAQLREGLQQTQQLELERLYRKLPDLDERARQEIHQFADRLVGKMLHPPLSSLRDESQTGPPHKLLDALRRLFQLKE